MPSSLKDNRPARGSVGAFLRSQIVPESKLSFVSAYFSVNAYHIQNGSASNAILGSSNFTVPGLGLGQSGNNIELNLVVDSDRDRRPDRLRSRTRDLVGHFVGLS